MAVVAVLGAGDLGGALAHALARRDRCREVRLIDRAGRVAEGKALDIQQAGPVEGFGTIVSGCADSAAVAGAAVVALADAAGPPVAEWQGEEGLDVLRRAHATAPRAVVVCAGTSHAWLVERGVAELGVPRTSIVGSAPLALGGALRALLSLEVGVSPREVFVPLMGRPPARAVVAWEAASAGGKRLTDVLSPASLVRMEERLAQLWPPGPHALAAAACQVVEAIVAGSCQQLSCFVVLDGELGLRGQVTALPVRFGGGRVRDITLPALSAAERTALENALAGAR